MTQADKQKLLLPQSNNGKSIKTNSQEGLFRGFGVWAQLPLAATHFSTSSISHLIENPAKPETARKNFHSQRPCKKDLIICSKDMLIHWGREFVHECLPTNRKNMFHVHLAGRSVNKIKPNSRTSYTGGNFSTKH